MIYFLLCSLVLLLMVMSFGIGYYLGKGKIEVVKKMNERDSELYLQAQMKMLKIQEEAMERANQLERDILGIRGE